MSGIRAEVKNGRISVDEPTTLPEGTVLDLVIDDEGDNLTVAERRALDDAISEAWESAKAGQVTSGKEVLDTLRARSK